MARKKRWSYQKHEKGVSTLKLSSWKYFSDYINQILLDHKDYIFRGQANSKWKLEPAIDRIIKNPKSWKRNFHLKNFKYETRGRRGPNPSAAMSENDWWALGQHHGLVTPLLDWTESPFVALYFAASSAVLQNKKAKELAVFALFQSSIEKFNKVIQEKEDTESVKSEIFKVIKPLSDENS